MTHTEHAIRCGVDMAGKKAVAIEDLSAGGWTAWPVDSPETQETILPVGFWVSLTDYDWFKSYGIDYVILEA